MKQLHQSEFLSLFYEESLEMIKSSWTTETQHASIDQMKKEMLIYAGFLKELTPKRILSDTSHFLFLVDIQMQDWVAENFLAVANRKGVKRAYLNTTDVITQLSIEQANEELHNTVYQIAYFDNEAEARQWLLK